MLHNLRMDGQGAEPLLQLCPQFLNRHAAVVARKRLGGEVVKWAWPPERLAEWRLGRKYQERTGGPGSAVRLLPEAGPSSRRALFPPSSLTTVASADVVCGDSLAARA